MCQETTTWSLSSSTTPAPDVVDLKGWSLWYRMTDDQEERRLVIWGKPTHLPGYGHLLLAREGEDVGAAADGTFDVPIFERRGGLQPATCRGRGRRYTGVGRRTPELRAVMFRPLRPRAAPALNGCPGPRRATRRDTDDSAPPDFQSRTSRCRRRATRPRPSRRMLSWSRRCCRQASRRGAP